MTNTDTPGTDQSDEKDDLAGKPLCDHLGPCPPSEGGCRWVQFERSYTPCPCGGWDERWTSRDRSIRLDGRHHHRRACMVYPPAPEPEYVDCTCGHPNDEHQFGECPFPGCGCGVVDEDDSCQHEWELRSEHDLWVCAWCQTEVTSPPGTHRP